MKSDLQLLLKLCDVRQILYVMRDSGNGGATISFHGEEDQHPPFAEFLFDPTGRWIAAAKPEETKAEARMKTFRSWPVQEHGVIEYVVMPFGERFRAVVVHEGIPTGEVYEARTEEEARQAFMDAHST